MDGCKYNKFMKEESFMKKLISLVLVLMMALPLVNTAFAADSYDIIYLTPSTASAFWSPVIPRRTSLFFP